MQRTHYKGLNFRFFVVILQAIFLFQNYSVYSQIQTVWALGDGEKVLRENLNHPDKKGNFTWDGKTIRIKGLYNEVLAFQVILETGQEGATGIEIAVENPVNKQSGKVIGGNTLKYGPPGTIEIFTQHYLEVPENRYTPPSWFYGSPASAPKHLHGWIPDALIPVNAKNRPSGAYDDLDPQEFGKTGQTVNDLGGLPIDIGPSRNQGFWIDIHLPRDRKNFPAGIYSGKVQVLEKGRLIKDIPVEITLLPEYLPDENATNIWLYTSAVYSYFNELQQDKVDEMLKFEGHRHRIDVVGGFAVNRTRFNKLAMDNYKPWLDGSAFTPANGYWGPGVGSGEKYFPVGIYGANVLGNTKEEVQAESNLWVDWFKQNAPDVVYFWYITDEPPVSRYPWVKERAGWVHSNPGTGKELPVFTTRGYQKELEGAIDIWSAYNGVKLEDLELARKEGGDYFFYNGLRPHNGTTILEGAAVDFRLNSWLLYKYGINCHFIWHGTHWRHNWQGPKGNLHQNVYQSPLTFTEFGENEHGNGAGILFYPGRMPYYPEEDRGMNNLFPSVRLKNIRRGQQDALLMKLAEEKAGREPVVDIINKVVPKAMNEIEKEDPIPWSENGDDYDRARDALLKLIIN